MTACPRVEVSLPEKVTHDELVALVESWVNRLLAPDQVVELRALGVRRGQGKPHTEGGFFGRRVPA